MAKKTVKIRLTNDRGVRTYLLLNYFSKRRGEKKRMVDNYYLTENSRWATPIPVGEAQRWMREAKYIAGIDGDVIEKAEYILHGKPTTLRAAGLRKPRKKVANCQGLSKI